MLSNKKNFWIILDHPKQFLMALYLSIHFKKKHKGKINLLISKHEYWKYFDISKYEKHFDTIDWFKRLDYPPPMMNKIKQFVAVLLLIPQLFFLKLRLKLIPFGNKDVIIGLSLCQFLENMVLSINPSLKSISLLSLSEFHYYENKPDSKKFVSGFSSKVSYWIMKKFGLHETIFSHRKKLKKLGDGDYYLSYKKGLKEIYSGLILTVAKTGEKLSRKPRSNIMYKNVYISDYPVIRFDESKKYDKKEIIFMGQPLLSLGKRSKKKYLEKLNDCLLYLSRIYGNKYKLIYKIHPRENYNEAIINYGNFTIEKKRIPAEIYFMENRKIIEAVFSVSSSTFQSALNAGLKSYLFAKVFPHDKNSIEVLYKACGEIPENSFIKNLKSKPKDLTFAGKYNNDNFLKYVDILIE